MQAVILVGGMGTRLQPLTCRTPKAMVPIANRPFLEHLLTYLKDSGIRDIILAMGYLPDLIRSRLGDGGKLGVKLHYLVEESPLGTAGAVKNAEHLLDGPFLVLNGDILTEIDLAEMIKRHREAKPKVSIALTPVDNPSMYGVVETDSNGRIRRFIEKPSPDRVTTKMINAGVYILEPDVLKSIPQYAPAMFESLVFPKLLEQGDYMMAYPSSAYWIDIGTPAKYIRANHDKLLKLDKATRMELEGRAHIDATAKIEGPVLIGEDCQIGANVVIRGPAVLGQKCRLDKGVVVDGAVLWDNVLVGASSVLKNCVAASRALIEAQCEVPTDCVLGESATITRGTRLAEGERIWPDGSRKRG